MSEHIDETLLATITEVFPEEISIITDNNIYGTVPIDYINDEFLRYNSDSKSLVGKYSNYYIGNKVELKVLETSSALASIKNTLSLSPTFFLSLLCSSLSCTTIMSDFLVDEPIFMA